MKNGQIQVHLSITLEQIKYLIEQLSETQQIELLGFLQQKTNVKAHHKQDLLGTLKVLNIDEIRNKKQHTNTTTSLKYLSGHVLGNLSETAFQKIIKE